IPHSEGDFAVKNSQVAVLSAVILAGAAIVAGSNWLLMRGPRAEQPAGRPRVVVAMMPKSKGNSYFIACRQGAEEAAKELDVDLIWDGPDGVDPARQNQVVESWITRGVDVIAVAAENGKALSSVLRKAQGKGIKVVTWDSDAEPDARDFFVNQATPQGIGETLMDHAARVLQEQGDPDAEFAIITASLTAANMIEWQKYIEQRRQEKYKHIKQPDVRPCDDELGKAKAQAKTIMNSNPKVKLIMAICSPAVPGAAAAVKEA